MPYEQTIRHACLFVFLGYISYSNDFGMLVPQDFIFLKPCSLLHFRQFARMAASANRPDDGIKAVELVATSGSTAAVLSTPGTSCPEATIPKYRLFHSELVLLVRQPSRQSLGVGTYFANTARVL